MSSVSVVYSMLETVYVGIKKNIEEDIISNDIFFNIMIIIDRNDYTTV